MRCDAMERVCVRARVLAYRRASLTRPVCASLRHLPAAAGDCSPRCSATLRLPQPLFAKIPLPRLNSTLSSHPSPPRMDPTGAPSPGPDQDPYATDDFVHVSNASSGESSSRAEHADSGPAVQDEAEGMSEEDRARGEGASEGREDADGGRGAEGGRRVLPVELAKGVVLLQCESSAEGGSCDVYLVGTAHVSQESCREVQAIISCLKPQAVFLELCSSRISILTPQNLQVPSMAEMIDMWKKKKMNAFGILYSWFLAKVAQKLEVLPGAEFRVAYEEAMSYGGKVILGDRPVHITLKRTWGKMTLWHKTKFLYYILFQTIFLPSPENLNKMLKEMDDIDMLTLVIQEMSKVFPTLMDTLLHERDMYMSSTLLRVAREHSSVVAVVGKGHLSGIQNHWKQPIQLRHLLEVPPRGVGLSRTKVFASVGVAFTGIATAIYLLGKR